MTTVAIVVVVGRLFFDAWVLEKFDLPKIISCDEKLPVAGSVDRVHVCVVKTWPDTLDWPSEQASPGRPFSVLGAGSTELLLRGQVEEHELIGLRVDDEALAVLGPIEVGQRAGQTDVRLAVLGELLLCIDLPDVDLGEPSVGSKSDKLAAGRDLDVFDPGVLLARLGRLGCAKHLEAGRIQDLDLTVPVSYSEEGAISGPVDRGWIVGQLG